MATNLNMPQMGYDMQEGTLVRWLKSVGDEVSLGEAVAEIETDKAVVEFESTAEGVLLELLVDEGTTVAVGESIATVGAEGETLAAGGGGDEEAPEEEPMAEEPSEADTEEAPEAEEAEAEAAAIPLPASPSEVRASPIARRLAAERGVDLNTVEGTGPGGRILRSDVLAAEPMPVPAEEPQEEEPEEAPEAMEEPSMPEEEAPEAVEEAPAEAEEEPIPEDEEPVEAVEEEPDMEAPEEVEEAEEPEPEPETETDDMALVPLTRMRQQIARTTVGSKTTIPHFYVTADIDMTEAMSLRKEINASLEGDARVSVNDLVIKACVHTIKEYPRFNSSYTDDGIRMHDSINIGIAIADENGLIMPAILDCDDKSLTEISSASKDLVKRSQSGTLHAEEYTGGTFSISNMGMFDVTSFVAIIQPPQSAVLAIGTVQKRPVVQGDSVVVREMMSATLSVDHRVSDGAEGAQFIVQLKEYLEHPLRLLV
ncbi:MAG: dihydrolipoamide acetyltransferase family protein [Chloroflexi bacterium]|nr:dihydrolipoamide acetyltransferase family protein [Chloroflexota bacterium]